MNLTTRFLILFSFLSLLGLSLIVAVIFSTWQGEHIQDELDKLRKAVEFTIAENREDLVDINNYSLYMQLQDSKAIMLKQVIHVPDSLLTIPFSPEYMQNSIELDGHLYLWVAVPSVDKKERYLAFYTEDDLTISEFFSIYGVPILVIAIICLWVAVWTALILSTSYKKIEHQKKELELQHEDLVDARKQAEESNVAKSTFLANMSHELRTPLNAIIGYCEILQEDAEDKIYDNITKDLTKVHAASDQLLILINDILDLSKIEAGKMLVNIEPVNINKLIDEVKTIINPITQKYKNKFYITFNSSHPLIHSDPVKLRQVIVNLVSNACKFSEKGTVSLTINYITVDNKKFHQFIVEDNGIGMSEQEISKIFEPFVQADGSITRSYGGTGLGLSITNRFVEMLGGTISVESEADKGSIFTVMLPEKAD